VVRRVPERWLHPARRRTALERLAREPPAALLVVCNGNIFRSPFAAALLCRALGDRTPGGRSVDSAGFIGPGRPSPPEAVLAAARWGIDLRDHRSQLVTMPLVRAADLIVAMEAAQRRIVCERFGRSPQDVLLLGDLDPAPILSRDIKDPWDEGPEACVAAYERVARCAAELARALERVPAV
jgi:protein-tyrosine-phosphatase